MITKCIILNSGLGHRMGDITRTHPKCMTEISEEDTILSRQLRLLSDNGIKDIVITTGYFDQILIDYCYSLKLPLNYLFVKNPIYDKTNYIYSIYCAREVLKDDDVMLMHGDLVFDEEVLRKSLDFHDSCMSVSSTLPLPEKDFKAVVKDDRVLKVGIEFFDDAYEAQALYKLKKEEWLVWLEKIIEFCETGNTNVYAEKALNEITNRIHIYPLDVKDMLCAEIDNKEDLENVRKRIK